MANVHAQETWRDVALPLIVHNNLKYAYRRFVLRHNPKVASAMPLGSHLPVLANGDPLLPHSFGDPQSLPATFEFDRAAWAAQNDRFRKKSVEFLEEESVRPVASICCLRMVLATVQCMEKEEFFIGSKRYEMLEQAKAAKADASQEGKVLLRDYQALVHARGDIEAKGTMKMRMLLFDTRLWVFICERDLTNKLKVMTFLGLTSAEASTERHLGIPNRSPSNRILLTVEQPHLIDAVLQIPQCLLCAWSFDFLQHNDLRATATQMKLIIHLILLHDNTNFLEVTNAQLRCFVVKSLNLKP